MNIIDKLPEIDIEIKRTVLDGGTVVIVNERPWSSSVYVYGGIVGGLCIEEVYGEANFTSSLLLKRYRRKTARQIVVEIEGMGASASFRAGYEAVIFTLMSRRENFEKVMGKVLKYASRPSFPEKEIKNARSRIASIIRENEQSPRFMGLKIFKELMFTKDNPYGRPIEGYVESIMNISRSNLISYHRKLFHKGNFIIAIAGGICFNEAVNVVEKALTYIEDGRTEVKWPETPEVKGVREEVYEMLGKSEARIVLGSSAIPKNHPDYVPLLAANDILGSFGLFGRLGKRIRDEEGLAYGVWSSLSLGKEAGYWTVEAGVNPKNLDKAYRMILEELDRISSEPVSEKELNQVKGDLVGSLAVDLERNSFVARLLFDIEFYGLGTDYISRLRRDILNLKVSDILNVSRKYFKPDNYIAVFIKPK